MTENSSEIVSTTIEYVGGYYRDELSDWRPFAGLTPTPDAVEARAKLDERVRIYSGSYASAVARAVNAGRVELRARVVKTITSEWTTA